MARIWESLDSENDELRHELLPLFKFDQSDAILIMQVKDERQLRDDAVAEGVKTNALQVLIKAVKEAAPGEFKDDFRSTTQQMYQLGFVLGGQNSKNMNTSSMGTTLMEKIDQFFNGAEVKKLQCKVTGENVFEYDWARSENGKLISENSRENKQKYGPLWRQHFPGATCDEETLEIPNTIWQFVVKSTGGALTGAPDVSVASWMRVELKNKKSEISRGRRAIAGHVLLMGYDQIVSASTDPVPIAFLTDMRSEECFGSWYEDDEKNGLQRVDYELSQHAMVKLMKALLDIEEIDRELVEVFERVKNRVNPFSRFQNPLPSDVDMTVFSTYLETDDSIVARNCAIVAEGLNPEMFHAPPSPYWQGVDEDMLETGDV